LSISNGEATNWEAESLCSKPENKELDFFSTDPGEVSAAKNLCFSCPVRGDCIEFALENGKIWGVWGGRDANEIRRILSVNANGEEVRRGRFPQCGYCGARTSRLTTKTVDKPDGGRWTTVKAVECTECGFEWKSRTSANAVNAYHTARAVKAERRDKKRALNKKGPSTRSASKASAKPARPVDAPEESSQK